MLNGNGQILMLATLLQAPVAAQHQWLEGSAPVAAATSEERSDSLARIKVEKTEKHFSPPAKLSSIVAHELNNVRVGKYKRPCTSTTTRKIIVF